MLKDLIDRKFYSLLNEAAEKIRQEQFIRVLAHYDGDGGNSAIILTTALKRLGKRFHLGYIKNLEGSAFHSRVGEFPDMLTVIVDAGSDQSRFIEDFKNVIILDHHFYTPGKFPGININARDFGIDGTRGACGSTMAFLMALALDEKNSDLIPFMMAGAIADKQDIGGFSELNEVLVREYGKNVKRIRTLNLEGTDLLDGITYSTDPFFLDLTGKPEATEEFLTGQGIDPRKHISSLTEDEKRTLTVSLSLRLISQNAGIEALRYLENDLSFFEGMDFSAKEISSIVDGNAKVGQNSLPVIYFLGQQSVKNEVLNNWRIFKTKLIEYTYRTLKDVYEESAIRYFYAPESEMAGAIGGVLMLYLLKQDKPVIGFNVGAYDTKVSSRGPRQLVRKGLNLSKIMGAASAEVGGSGGGHDIAAGAVIPRGKEKQFVEIVNRMVADQIGKVAPFQVEQ
ncbi:MAG: DHH family phosphoesterase [Thermoplasmataceae archaeon]|jgi:RecJ-like exonuclease|nr:DHH family phosphoesterase [Candidatus Thermoplasmatota archaeon]